MKITINIVQGLVDVPISIDSSDPRAMETALKHSDGKPIINSINAKNMDIMIPLAKRYGAAIIVLTLDESIPETKEKHHP